MKITSKSNMDTSDSSDTLTESFFLSSTTQSYNGLLDTESYVDLEQILSEYSSMLNCTIEDSLSEEYLPTRTNRPSIIIAGSNNYCTEPEMTEISQIRDTFSYNSIGSSVNRLSLSGMSFCMEKMENSICSDLMTHHSGKQLNWIVDNLPNNNKNIDNESCPSWNSLIDMSVNDQKTNPNLTSEESFKTPDTSILGFKTEEDCPHDKTIIYDQNLNNERDTTSLTSFNIQISDSNFFIRKKKKPYFPTPRNIIDQTKSKGISKNSRDEEFERIIAKLPKFTLEDISNPEWPSFNDDDLEDRSETSELARTSTLNDSETSPPGNFGKFSFGASRLFNFLARKRSTRYFKTPKK